MKNDAIIVHGTKNWEIINLFSGLQQAVGRIFFAQWLSNIERGLRSVSLQLAAAFSSVRQCIERTINTIIINAILF